MGWPCTPEDSFECQVRGDLYNIICIIYKHNTTYLQRDHNIYDNVIHSIFYSQDYIGYMACNCDEMTYLMTCITYEEMMMFTKLSNKYPVLSFMGVI